MLLVWRSQRKAAFFLASTSECYGDPQVSPQPETYWGHVNPVGPRGVYDESRTLRRKPLTTGLSPLSRFGYAHRARIFNTYGPRMRLNDGRALRANFLYQALNGEPITVYGDGKRDHEASVTFRICSTGIHKLLESNEHEPTSLGNPHEITILEFAERVRAPWSAPRCQINFHPLPQD